MTASNFDDAAGMPTAKLPVIHAVTDGAAACRPEFLARAEIAMVELKGRLAVHLRAPAITGRIFFALAEALAKLQRETGAWLIVNDRVDVAAAVGAWGVQLTSKSLSVSDALKVAPRIPVGASVHTSGEAIAAYDSGATWCVAGNVFPTESHPGIPGKHASFISGIAGAVPMPVIAIGGVQPEHVGELLDAGAYGFATIRGSGWNGASLLNRYIWEYDAHRARTQRTLAHHQRDPTRSST